MEGLKVRRPFLNVIVNGTDVAMRCSFGFFLGGLNFYKIQIGSNLKVMKAASIASL